VLSKIRQTRIGNRVFKQSKEIERILPNIYYLALL